MEPLTLAVDELKRLAKSANDFAHALLNSGRRSPGNERAECECNEEDGDPLILLIKIDILKRLQREAFSDIMKLRDRQDKVERLLAFYKSSKGSPFQEASTHVRGNVDLLGALFIVDDVNEHKYDAIQRSGIRTGIDARLRFETELRENDKLVAEFIANSKGQGDLLGGPLSLAKVLYAAHFSDWLSAFAFPAGAQCRDVGVETVSNQEKGLSRYSDFEPPLLHQHHGSGIGLTVRKMNVVASFARFFSGFGMQVNADELACSMSTFGQIAWQLSTNTKLSLSGVHKKSRETGQNINLGALAFPVSIFKRNRFSETSAEEDSPRSRQRHNWDATLSLMLNSEIDESAKIGGWIESKSSNPGHLEWAVTVSDLPEDELGWGLSCGGVLQGPTKLDHFQVETFLNMNFGKRFRLQSGVVYVKDQVTHFPAVMIRSNWSL